MNNMNNAIVALTRGYPTLDGYKILIKRNNALFEIFGNKYDYWLYHEGDITDEAQQYIAEQTPGIKINWLSIADKWDAKHSYESMCRFYGYYIWEICQFYDNILRVDEDCHLIKLDNDPFESMGDNICLKSMYFAESHSETNAMLPLMIENLTGENPDEFYNHKFPYTNVMVSNVKFWLTEPVASVLKQICLSPDQTKYRFGDLPVHGSLLNIYAKGKVGTIQGLEYYHYSHDYNVTSQE